MKYKEDDQHEESAQSADTKAFLKLVDAMFITGRREDAEISDTFEFHFCISVILLIISEYFENLILLYFLSDFILTFSLL